MLEARSESGVLSCESSRAPCRLGASGTPQVQPIDDPTARSRSVRMGRAGAWGPGQKNDVGQARTSREGGGREREGREGPAGFIGPARKSNEPQGALAHATPGCVVTWRSNGHRADQRPLCAELFLVFTNPPVSTDHLQLTASCALIPGARPSVSRLAILRLERLTLTPKSRICRAAHWRTGFHDDRNLSAPAVRVITVGCHLCAGASRSSRCLRRKLPGSVPYPLPPRSSSTIVLWPRPSPWRPF